MWQPNDRSASAYGDGEECDNNLDFVMYDSFRVLLGQISIVFVESYAQEVLLIGCTVSIVMCIQGALETSYQGGDQLGQRVVADISLPEVVCDDVS